MPVVVSERLHPLLIAGPTASGKTAYALARAAEQPSIIVNADSMQVYRELSIITARPTPDEERQVPHALYGFVPAAEAYSTGRYVEDVRSVLAEAANAGRRPIIVGGTGLYFMALLKGLSPVPSVPEDIRAMWRAEAIRLGPAELHAELARRDPVMASRLRPSDPQRVTRALEVLAATGQSLAEWHETPGTPLIALEDCDTAVILPDREIIYARADRRFDVMMETGAPEEAAALAQLQLDPALPAMRALGVPQLLALADGRMTRADAIAEAKLGTRQYIKRQMTWLRRNMYSWNEVQL